MDEKVKKAIEELGQSVEAFKKTNNEVIEKTAKGIVDKALEAHRDELAKVVADCQAAKEAAEKAELAAKRRVETEKKVEQAQGKTSKETREAFLSYLKRGIDRMTPDQVHAMSALSDPDGGYLILPELDTEITKILYDSSPVRQVATVKTIGSDQYERPQLDNLATASWKDREVAVSDSGTPTLKKLTIKVHELEADPKLPVNLVNDSYVNVEAEINESVAMSFAIAEATAFVTGDGVGQPRGILSYADGTGIDEIEQIASGASGALSTDGLVDLVYALKSGYRANARFAMNRLTQGEVMKLVDGQGNYIWQPSFQAGQPPTLLGFPVVEFNDLPDVAANALSVVFGDFRRGYFIIDRMGTTVLVNPYKENGFINYYTTKRVGGGVNNGEALKIMAIDS